MLSEEVKQLASSQGLDATVLEGISSRLLDGERIMIRNGQICVQSGRAVEPLGDFASRYLGTPTLKVDTRRAEIGKALKSILGIAKKRVPGR